MSPLLILYAVPLTVVRGGVPMLLFLFAAVGWLALMLAEGRERLAGWGRALGRRSQKENDPLTYTPPEPLGVVGRRIGAAAMGLALIVPVLMPWAGTSLFKGSGGEGGSGSGGGGGNVSQLNPTVQLGGWLTARTETTLLKFTSTDTNPEYLRVVTLDTFDGRAWKWKQAAQKPAGSARDVPAGPLDGAPGSDVQTDVNIIGLSQVWLPVPYPGGSIDGLTGGWAYDGDTLDVFGTGSSSTHGQQYSVVSRPDEPTAVELQGASPAPDDLEAKYTALPDDIPASVQAADAADHRRHDAPSTTRRWRCSSSSSRPRTASRTRRRRTCPATTRWSPSSPRGRGSASSSPGRTP